MRRDVAALSFPLRICGLQKPVFQNLAYVGKEKPELVKDIWNIMIDEIKKDKSLDKGDNDFHHDIREH